VPRRAVRRLADEDPVHRRRTLETRGRVDDVARDHALTLDGPRAERDECLARVRGRPDLQLAVAERVADRERRADGALGIVLVRDGRAEDRHHRVADELLDGAAVPLDLRAQPRVIRRHMREPVRVLLAAGRARLHGLTLREFAQFLAVRPGYAET
jgi:hypothetical protein